MTVQRMDNVGIVVEDLEAATAFFVELGPEIEGETTVDGDWASRVVGLHDMVVDVTIMKTPDGNSTRRRACYRQSTATSTDSSLSGSTYIDPAMSAVALPGLISRFDSVAASVRSMRIACLALVVGCALGGCTSSDDSVSDQPPAWNDGCAGVRNLVILVWADAAGILPPDKSLDAWVSDNPDFSSFDAIRTESGIVDLRTIFANRSEANDPWNDLLQYQDTVGDPYLFSTDLEDVATLTPPADPNDDLFGWGICPPTPAE